MLASLPRTGQSCESCREPVGREFTVIHACDGVVETYDVAAAGLEQAFVFARLPPGNG